VHRDFKPGNVLVGDGGRVAVLDFGLARAAEPEPGGEGEIVSFEALAARPGEAIPPSLTQTGTRLGTPAYMAPEQRRGETVGPAADQYAFCLALSRALAAAGHRVHRGLQRALARGLADDPAARFPALAPLLREIDRGLHLTRRRALQAGAVGALLLLPGLGVLLRDAAATRQALCSGSQERLRGIWDGSRRGVVRTAFLATGAPFAAAAWKSTEESLDRYTAEWAAMRTEACEATRLRGEQSAELMDRRMACLEERRRELAAFAGILSRADRGLVGRAAEAAQDLPPLSACADASALMAPFREPEEPAARRRIAAVRGSLARARALRRTGAYAEGLAAARQASRQAEDLAFWPLAAEALLLQGEIEERAARPEEAAATLHRALLAAEAGRHDRVAVEAFARLVRVVGYQQARHEEGHRYARQGLALLGHLDRRETLEATLADHQGTLYLHQGKFAAALERHRHALALRLKVLGPGHVQVANTLTRIGNVLTQQGDLEGALRHYRRALAVKEKLLGPHHPDVAQSLDAVGGLLYRRAAYGEALALHRRALAIGERALGADHTQVATTLSHLGNAYSGFGRDEEALASHRRAVAIFERALGPSHPNVAFALNNVGVKLLDRGEPAAAAAVFRRALAIQEAAYGSDHPWVAQALFSLGGAEHGQGLYGPALAHRRRALAIWEKTLGPDHFLTGYGASGLGQALLGIASPAEARPHLERALVLFSREKLDPVVVAETRFALARALAMLRREPARARRLAADARAALAAAGPPGRRKLAEIDAWLARQVQTP
jgi:tetratricopeptide (TPR) repeat protein